MTAGRPAQRVGDSADHDLPVCLENFDVGAACALATMMMGFMLPSFFVYCYGGAPRPEGVRMVTGGVDAPDRLRGATYATLGGVRGILPVSVPLDGRYGAQADRGNAELQPDLLDRRIRRSTIFSTC